MKYKIQLPKPSSDRFLLDRKMMIHGGVRLIIEHDIPDGDVDEYFFVFDKDIRDEQKMIEEYYRTTWFDSERPYQHYFTVKFTNASKTREELYSVKPEFVCH